MNSKSARLAPFLAILALCFAGCGSTGGVKEGRVSFGIPAVFSFDKEVNNLKVTETATHTKTAVADTKTKLQIGVFVYNGEFKGIAVSAPKEKQP